MKTPTIERTLYKEFLSALKSLPSANSRQGRDALLSGLPTNVALNRSDNPHVDLSNLLDQLQSLGRLTRTGERPLIILAENAEMQMPNTDLGRTFSRIIRDLEAHYGGDPPSGELPEVPEKLIFEGRDERLPRFFFEKAIGAGNSVARLMVPIGGKSGSILSFGTGWLIGTDLLITNFHVVGCSTIETITESDLTAQVENTVCWFDYHSEGGSKVEVRSRSIAAYSRKLDYALLRLEKGTTAERTPLPLRRSANPISDGTRLNIVQHPGGGPLRYAVRNNFYAGKGEENYQLRYLTDTEHGSSGSPVLDDAWQVAGLHHAYRRIPKTAYKGEIIRYHNEGIDIRAILEDLPEPLRKEIGSNAGKE